MRPSLAALSLATACLAPLLGANAAERDPFWPVGYEPKAAVIRVTPPENDPNPGEDGENVTAEFAGEIGQLSAAEKAAVTAKLRPGGYLSRGDTQFLFINGEMLTVGEKLIINHNGKKHAFVIERFKQRSVVMTANWNFTEQPTEDSDTNSGGNE